MPMPKPAGFETYNAQIIEGDGRLFEDTFVAICKTAPTGSAVVIPSFGATTRTPQSHQVQVLNRGEGRAIISIEGGFLIDGQPSVEIGPGQTAILTSTHDSTVPGTAIEYTLIAGLP
jgi:hypothetical protein